MKEDLTVDESAAWPGCGGGMKVTSDPEGTATRRYVIRIALSAGPSSAPLEQFYRYRVRTIPNEATVYVSYFRPDVPPGEIVSVDAAAEALRSFAASSIVSCEGRFTAFCWTLWELSRACSRNGILGVLHVHQPMLGAVVSLLRTFGLFRRWYYIYTMHNTYATYSMKNKIATCLASWGAEVVTTVGAAAARSAPGFLREGKGLGLIAIDNGVDIERIDAVISQSNVRRTDSAFRVLVIGRLQPVKGADLVIEACRRLGEECEVRICGDGPLRAALRAQAERAGMADRTFFLGLIDREEVYRQMTMANCLVLISAWEGLPVAALEAMATKLPVLLSDIPPHREIRAKGAGPILIQREASELAAHLQGIMEMTSDERCAMGRQNRLLVTNHYSLHRAHTRWTELYAHADRSAGSRALGMSDEGAV